MKVNYYRFKQVIKFGWIDSKSISQECEKRRLVIYIDIIRCYFKYNMWSNHYRNERFAFLADEDRVRIGSEYKLNGQIKEAWFKDFIENKKFFKKYSSIKYDMPRLLKKKYKEYTRRYNAGSNLRVETDVLLCRQHYLQGSIKIGNNVTLAKHVFIDYSGELVIKDNVMITNGVIIETHYHPNHSDYRIDKEIVEPTKLIIENDAMIGSRAIILPTCHYIGKGARVGSGAVVTKDVPDYSIVAGVPAKVIRQM